MPQKIEYLSITENRLYGLGRKRDLASVFKIGLSELQNLSHDNNYFEWAKKQEGKKPRLIEQANPALSKILSQLHIVLSFAETPHYLLSGKKNIKPKDNASLHCNSKFLINVDIERFYQSTKREYVYTAFRDTFKQSTDVAALLADLVTYNGHIPTGTATSQLLAYWAYNKTFHRIYNLCKSNGIIMSIWVDDITFSSTKPFPRNWVRDIGAIMGEVQLSLKTSKTKKFNSLDYKTVTGSAISPSGNFQVKNEKRKEILDIIGNRRVEDLNLKELRRLFGKLTSQRQYEIDFFDNIFHRSKVRLRKLERKASQKNKPHMQIFTPTS